MRILFFAGMLLFFSCNSTDIKFANTFITKGQMPAVTIDNQNYLHITYGLGDSLMYLFSSDQGKTFSTPELIAVIPKLAASHTRGPQIAFTTAGLVLTACDASGNIFSFNKFQTSVWKPTMRVNDVDTVARENLMSLSSDGTIAYAVWLDLRDKHNKIFGSKSVDGGMSWSKNEMVYASPDTTVCECCKPSVLVKGNNVYVMFRNWLNGNRDLYLVRSTNGGNNFGKAEKLGNGSWKLNGCPMDGGGITTDENGVIRTVWKRDEKIYAASPGQQEIALGKGRSCAIEIVNGRNVYAWVEGGVVIVLTPAGEKIKLGKGQLPVLKAVDKSYVLCLWEVDKQIHGNLLEM